MSHFIIRTYGMQELAVRYFPHCTPKSASAQLKKWIRHPLLLGKLAAAGYRSGQKIFTPRQVEVLTAHLGCP